MLLPVLLLSHSRIEPCKKFALERRLSPTGVRGFPSFPRSLLRIHPIDLDMNLITSYWKKEGSGARAYHHTAPISMNYAIHEALRIVDEEGLEVDFSSLFFLCLLSQARWKRHFDNASLFWKGLEELGLECLVEHQHRLPSLTTVKVNSPFPLFASSQIIFLSVFLFFSIIFRFLKTSTEERW